MAAFWIVKPLVIFCWSEIFAVGLYDLTLPHHELWSRVASKEGTKDCKDDVDEYCTAIDVKAAMLWSSVSTEKKKKSDTRFQIFLVNGQYSMVELVGRSWDSVLWAICVRWVNCRYLVVRIWDCGWRFESPLLCGYPSLSSFCIRLFFFTSPLL